MFAVVLLVAILLGPADCKYRAYPEFNSSPAGGIVIDGVRASITCSF